MRSIAPPPGAQEKDRHHGDPFAGPPHAPSNPRRARQRTGASPSDRPPSSARPKGRRSASPKSSASPSPDYQAIRELHARALGVHDMAGGLAGALNDKATQMHFQRQERSGSRNSPPTCDVRPLRPPRRRPRRSRGIREIAGDDWVAYQDFDDAHSSIPLRSLKTQLSDFDAESLIHCGVFRLSDRSLNSISMLRQNVRKRSPILVGGVIEGAVFF